MPRFRPPRHVRIFLASPGDVQEERGLARKRLERLERTPLVRRDFTLEAVSWDDPDAPAPMLAALTPQQAVARALPRPSECDLTVVILWGRMGTPLDERKPDGSPYLSGTEWEFEDARRAGKPVLVYRRTTALPAAGTAEIAEQRAKVQQFFDRFTGPGGVLRGGVTTYDTVEQFADRLEQDVESLLPGLRLPDDALPPDAGWWLRTRENVRRWHGGRLLLVLTLGLLVTLAAGAGISTFDQVQASRGDAPALAHAARAVLTGLVVAVPLVLLTFTWWWLGRRRADTPG